jgi:hypothetical protein
MTAATIYVKTLRYEITHGHKPRQARASKMSPWAFQIDTSKEPVFITASYKDALKQAKAMAQYSVTVLP